MISLMVILFLAFTVRILWNAGKPTKFVDYTNYSDLVRLRGQDHITDAWRRRYCQFPVEETLPPSTFKITIKKREENHA